jgi:hypothetical protein
MLRDAPAPVAKPPPFGYRAAGIASPALTIPGPTSPRNQSCDRCVRNRLAPAGAGNPLASASPSRHVVLGGHWRGRRESAPCPWRIYG